MNFNPGLCMPYSSLQEGQARKESRIEFRNFFEGFFFHILQYKPYNLFRFKIFLRIHLRTALFWVTKQRVICLFFFFWCYNPQWARVSSFTRFLDHTHQRTTVGRTPLDEWSVRRRDLYMTTHTTLTADKRPCPRCDSNPQSQQTSGRRPTP